MLKLQRKNDFIVYTYLSSTQKRIYQTFLDSEKVGDFIAARLVSSMVLEAL
jgi:SNF2 family DNA or RNA helicase